MRDVIQSIVAVLAMLAALIALAAFLTVTWAPPAAAGERRCFPRDQLARHMAERHGAAPVARGVTHGGALVKVWSTPDGAAWAVVTHAPGGRIVCALAAGTGWQRLARAAARVGPGL